MLKYLVGDMHPMQVFATIDTPLNDGTVYVATETCDADGVPWGMLMLEIMTEEWVDPSIVPDYLPEAIFVDGEEYYHLHYGY
jgi:hypothetical protein